MSEARMDTEGGKDEEHENAKTRNASKIRHDVAVSDVLGVKFTSVLLPSTFPDHPLLSTFWSIPTAYTILYTCLDI
jgi:hypothetical protein